MDRLVYLCISYICLPWNVGANEQTIVCGARAVKLFVLILGITWVRFTYMYVSVTPKFYLYVYMYVHCMCCYISKTLGLANELLKFFQISVLYLFFYDNRRKNEQSLLHAVLYGQKVYKVYWGGYHGKT
jgi:hypothetical protein